MTAPFDSRNAPLPVSVCIPVLDEEKNLPHCLAALSGAFPEIVVVDSGSTDRTPEVARDFGATLLEFRWNGAFPKKRNWALRHHAFTQPWILFLDADERVTPEFIDELRRTLPETSNAGFRISFDNWFMGRRLRHGDVFTKLALFRVGCGEYERFPEDHWSHLDMEVHEHPILNGNVGDICARLEHHDHRDLHHYIRKHNEYSTWEVHRYLWLKQADAAAWKNLTPRQRFKYRNLNKPWLGAAYFLASFVIKRGFLDGHAGWTLAKLKARYFDEIRMKIQEAERSEA